MMYFNRFGDTTVRKIKVHGIENLTGNRERDASRYGNSNTRLSVAEPYPVFAERQCSHTYDSVLQFFP